MDTGAVEHPFAFLPSDEAYVVLMYVEQKDRIRIRVRIVPANNDPKRHPRPSVSATEVGANGSDRWHRSNEERRARFSCHCWSAGVPKHEQQQLVRAMACARWPCSLLQVPYVVLLVSYSFSIRMWCVLQPLLLLLLFPVVASVETTAQSSYTYTSNVGVMVPRDTTPSDDRIAAAAAAAGDERLVHFTQETKAILCLFFCVLIHTILLLAVCCLFMTLSLLYVYDYV